MLLVVLACATPSRAISFLRGESPEPAATRQLSAGQYPTAAYPESATTAPLPGVSGYPGPTGELQPVTPTGTVALPATQFAPYPGAGEDFPAYPTTVQESAGSSAYPTPGSVTFVTPTLSAQLPYPGQGTPGSISPPTGFQSPTPQPGTSPQIATAIPSTPIPLNTALPPPAWINSELRASELDQVRLVSGKVQLLFFFAFWDGPSLAMAPLVHAVQEQFENRVAFVYLDVDDPAAGHFKEELGYMSQPEFFLVDPQGVVIEHWRGYVRIEELVHALETSIN